MICLKRYGGREIQLIVEYLLSTEQNRNETYEKVKRKLNHHFIPKQNKQHAWYLFYRMRQENKETITEYPMRLKEQAESCEFSEDRILGQLIQTIENNGTITKAIRKQWNLNKFFEEASQQHDLK